MPFRIPRQQMRPVDTLRQALHTGEIRSRQQLGALMEIMQIGEERRMQQEVMEARSDALGEAIAPLQRTFEPRATPTPTQRQEPQVRPEQRGQPRPTQRDRPTREEPPPAEPTGEDRIRHHELERAMEMTGRRVTGLQELDEALVQSIAELTRRGFTREAELFDRMRPEQMRIPRDWDELFYQMSLTGVISPQDYHEFKRFIDQDEKAEKRIQVKEHVDPVTRQKILVGVDVDAGTEDWRMILGSEKVGERVARDDRDGKWVQDQTGLWRYNPRDVSEAITDYSDFIQRMQKVATQIDERMTAEMGRREAREYGELDEDEKKQRRSEAMSPQERNMWQALAFRANTVEDYLGEAGIIQTDDLGPFDFIGPDQGKIHAREQYQKELQKAPEERGTVQPRDRGEIPDQEAPDRLLPDWATGEQFPRPTQRGEPINEDVVLEVYRKALNQLGNDQEARLETLRILEALGWNIPGEK